MFYNTASGGSDTAATVGGVLGSLVVILSVTVTVIVIVVILLRNHGGSGKYVHACALLKQ